MEHIFRSVVSVSRFRSLPRTITTNIVQQNALYSQQKSFCSMSCNLEFKQSGLQTKRFFNQDASHQTKPSLVGVLDREIHDETAELGQKLSTDQFPGFSVETDGAEVKLTKQSGAELLTVRFNVSSSLNEWPVGPAQEDPNGNQNKNLEEQEPQFDTALLSMPDFQIQVTKNNQTLEFSCYFEQPEQEEFDENMLDNPHFDVDEIVLYENEPKNSEFSVNVDYFHEDLQTSLSEYLVQHGFDENFGKNLVQFATNYEKKQYIGLMKRLKNFVSK